MIIDTFTFNNELLLLEARLAELENICDYHILVESKFTQSRRSKPLYFQENKHLFDKYKDKIIAITLEDYEIGGEGNWANENSQRNAILRGVNQLMEIGVKLKVNDRIIISDLDEICNAERVKEVIDKDLDVVSTNHIFGAYYLNIFARRNWYGSVFCKFSTINTLFEKHKDNTIQYLRSVKDYISHLENQDSWHFSGLGGFNLLWDKYLSCIEPYSKRELLDENKEKYRIQFQKHVLKEGHFWFVDDWNNKSIKLENLSVDLLPQYIKNNLHKYQDLLYYYE